MTVFCFCGTINAVGLIIKNNEKPFYFKEHLDTWKDGGKDEKYAFNGIAGDIGGGM